MADLKKCWSPHSFAFNHPLVGTIVPGLNTFPEDKVQKLIATGMVSKYTQKKDINTVSEKKPKRNTLEE